MASICDGAACLGLSTDLNGSTCLTNEVQCKDGHLTVPSQGVRQRRFSATAQADPATPGPVDAPNGTPLDVSGPRNPSLGILLSVPLVNPFCSRANIQFLCEFGVSASYADTDYFAHVGDISITGDATFVDTTPPFTVDTFPTTYPGVGLYSTSPVGESDSGHIFEHDHHNSYTVLGTCPAGGAFTFSMLSGVLMTARGDFRTVTGFSAAVSIIMSPEL